MARMNIGKNRKRKLMLFSRLSLHLTTTCTVVRSVVPQAGAHPEWPSFAGMHVWSRLRGQQYVVYNVFYIDIDLSWCVHLVLDRHADLYMYTCSICVYLYM